ncbi:MAG: FHA domain-containing protein, partial [Thermoanaerobaculia bacterium]
MRSDRAEADRAAAADHRLPVLSHLSGSRRGVTERLEGEILVVGTAAGADVRLSAEADAAVAPRRARLARRGASWVVEAEAGQAVWLNGRQVEAAALVSGDLLEIGEGGPALRFRLHPRCMAHKSMAEAFADCRDCARRAGGGPVGRAAVLATAVPRELATQTSPGFRLTVVGLLAVLIAATAWLVVRTHRLEARLAGESERLAAVTAWAEEADRGRRQRRVR